MRNSDPTTLVADLTLRLAEEFDTLPLSLVARAVKAAADASALFGEDVHDSLGTIEQIARENLNAVRVSSDDTTVVAE